MVDPDPQKPAEDPRAIDADVRAKVAGARTLEAEAEKAEAEALKAKIGAVPASGLTGDVTFQDNPGKAEAQLLAAKAVKEVARLIGAKVPKGIKTVFIYPAGSVPDLTALLAFRAQCAVIDRVLDEIQSLADAKAPITQTIAPPLSAMALAPEGLINLLSFFRTEYTVGGVDITLDESLLTHALAGCLTGAGLRVVLAGILDMTSLDPKGEPIQELAKTLSELLRKRANLKASDDSLKPALGLLDTLLDSLKPSDVKGAPPLAELVRQSALWRQLQQADTLVIAVKLQSTGGSFYSKKTFVPGRMPLFHMGAAVASYVFLTSTGDIRDAGVVPVHGGIFGAKRLKKEIDRQ